MVDRAGTVAAGAIAAFIGLSLSGCMMIEQRLRFSEGSSLRPAQCPICEKDDAYAAAIAACESAAVSCEAGVQNTLNASMAAFAKSFASAVAAVGGQKAVCNAPDITVHCPRETTIPCPICPPPPPTARWTPCPPAPSPTPLPAGGIYWRDPGFQTLMATLWQAPLVILSVVIAVAAFFGWQGYVRIGERLTRRTRKDVAQVASLAAAAGHLDAAWSCWMLALGLEDPSSEEEDIGKRLPVFKVDPPSSALVHLRGAKRNAEHALRSLEQVPRDSEVYLLGSRGGVDGEHVTREYLRAEALQSIAYYIACDPRSRKEDYQTAIRYSAAALSLMEDDDWVKRSRVDKYHVAPQWLDTFLYVRWKSRMETRKAREKLQEIEGFENFLPVVHRFAGKFTAKPEATT